MNVLLVCYHLEPMKTSAAVQMKDLAMAFKLAGHNVYFLAPSEKIHQSIDEEDKDGIKLIRIRANRNEDGGNVIRALHEFKMALLLPLKFNRTSLADKDIDLVAWYSPSIFFGIFIWLRARRSPNRQTRIAFNMVLATMIVQMALGIVTVMNSSPWELAIVHQFGAVVLWVLVLRARFLSIYPLAQSVRG